MLPSTEDLQHIRHFSASWDDKDVLDIIFEQGRWRGRPLSPLAAPPGPGADGHLPWQQIQECVQHLVAKILEWVAGQMGKDTAVFDPCIGEGLHGGALIEIPSEEHLYRELVEVWIPSIWTVRDA
jgi:hypothetical protein